jgi:hypothetical protein
MRSPHRALFQGVYRGHEKQREHLTAIKSLGEQTSNSFEHEHLYNCLSILDAKATALLTYDSILIAATSITLTNFPKQISVGSILVFAALVLAGLAAALCLHVIWVYWTDTLEFEDKAAIYYSLLSVRNLRTLSYRCSWLTSQIAMVLLIVGVLAERRFSSP